MLAEPNLRELGDVLGFIVFDPFAPVPDCSPDRVLG
jgi:hypothetical protein